MDAKADIKHMATMAQKIEGIFPGISEVDDEV